MQIKIQKNVNYSSTLKAAYTNHFISKNTHLSRISRRRHSLAYSADYFQIGPLRHDNYHPSTPPPCTSIFDDSYSLHFRVDYNTYTLQYTGCLPLKFAFSTLFHIILRNFTIFLWLETLLSDLMKLPSDIKNQNGFLTKQVLVCAMDLKSPSWDKMARENPRFSK